MKLILMYVSERFDSQTEMKFSRNEKHLAQLHIKSNNEFRLPENITKSDDPAKMLNAVLTRESIFSFSFVRHPYKR